MLAVSGPTSEMRARRARAIRTAILLGLMALAIYATFIILVAERGPV